MKLQRGCAFSDADRECFRCAKNGQDEDGRSLIPILDTSFLVDLMRGREVGLDLKMLSVLEEKSCPIFTTPMAALEQYLRAHLSADPGRMRSLFR